MRRLSELLVPSSWSISAPRNCSAYVLVKLVQRWLYVPHTSQCQDPALQRQSSRWLAAGQIRGRADKSGSSSGGAGAAAGGSTAAGARTDTLVQVLFSAAGMLLEVQ